jgi:hypothetical protein
MLFYLRFFFLRILTLMRQSLACHAHLSHRCRHRQQPLLQRPAMPQMLQMAQGARMILMSWCYLPWMPPCFPSLWNSAFQKRMCAGV